MILFAATQTLSFVYVCMCDCIYYMVQGLSLIDGQSLQTIEPISYGMPCYSDSHMWSRRVASYVVVCS